MNGKQAGSLVRGGGLSRVFNLNLDVCFLVNVIFKLAKSAARFHSTVCSLCQRKRFDSPLVLQRPH